MSEQAQTASVHTVNQPEWRGQFAAAAGRGADFALLLALQLGSGVAPTSIRAVDEETAEDNSFPQRLNHYRRAALDCSDLAAASLSKTASILKTQSVADARLWQCMHPDPHTLINNSKKLPADIIANCAFATQQARSSAQPTELAEDPTQLDDIIARSGMLMAS